MFTFKLAYRNIIGAGLRTWLNVFVLSLSFVIIILHKGVLDGWDAQARTEMKNWETGEGQYWQKNYDPFDPFTLTDSHGEIPGNLLEQVNKNLLTPILITQGTIYPEGRVQSVLIKGIDPTQKILQIPSEQLLTNENEPMAIIGASMAHNNRLKVGDYVTLRWRDVKGTFDAVDIKITAIFNTDVPTVDNGMVWLSLEKLREMMNAPGEATLLVKGKTECKIIEADGWVYKDLNFLLSDIDKIIKAKSFGGAILWSILILLAMLAIFDTQVLSIFRRQREIGTYVAMGMTRRQVVGLFTIEGAFNSVLAAIVGAIYGIPLFLWTVKSGIHMPVKGEDYGIVMASVMYPKYGAGLVISTILVIVIVTTLVSYWPSRKIAKMKPTEALRGKIQ